MNKTQPPELREERVQRDGSAVNGMAALADGQSFVSSTHMRLTSICNSSSRRSNAFCQVCGTHTYMQALTHKINLFKKPIIKRQIANDYV